MHFKTIEEEKRYFVRYALENAISDVICKKGTCSCVGDAKELFRVWLEDEDGELALNRLINLIIY